MAYTPNGLYNAIIDQDFRLSNLQVTGTLQVDGATTQTGAQTFAATIVANGGIKFPVAVGLVNGAITVSPGYVFLTKAGVAAMTLAAPTATTHDGYRIVVIAQTANAHTLTVAGGINGTGASGDVGTFGGAVGDLAVLVAYQGVWYLESKINVTFA